MSKLESTAAEWISSPHYTELPPYISKTGDWKLGHVSFLPVVAPLDSLARMV